MAVSRRLAGVETREYAKKTAALDKKSGTTVVNM
jgi:hypothetical protein